MDQIHANIKEAASFLGLELNTKQLGLLTDYLLMLQKWNKVYNLTALRTLDEMVSHHLLDSLAVVLPLQKQLQLQQWDLDQPVKILDVGSGAGLPGVILAICFPDAAVSCLDAVAKKMAFVRQVAATLGISNLSAIHARVESVQSSYSVVTSRAYASLTDFVTSSSATIASKGIWMAMKGKVPVNEIGSLPNDVDMFHVEHIDVPELDAERCIVWMKKRSF